MPLRKLIELFRQRLVESNLLAEFVVLRLSCADRKHPPNRIPDQPEGEEDRESNP